MGSVVVLNLHRTLTQDARAALVHKLAMLSLLDEAFVCRLLCVFAVILVFCSFKVTDAKHSEHVFLSSIYRVLMSFLIFCCPFLCRLVLSSCFELFLTALDLLVDARAPLLLLKCNHLLAREALGDN